MRIVGLGGSTRASSSTELLVRAVLDAVEARGAETELLCGPDLALPPYDPAAPLDARAERLVAAVRSADAVVLGSPGYHGSISGLVKNAIDYLEELRSDARPYLQDRPVATVVTAYGWQAAVTTLAELRQVVHALRGWPTPLGLAVNMAEPGGRALEDPGLAARVEEIARQLTTFADRALQARTPA
jgi:FMN reductase